jgi:hypothetical protein
MRVHNFPKPSDSSFGSLTALVDATHHDHERGRPCGQFVRGRSTFRNNKKGDGKMNLIRAFSTGLLLATAVASLAPVPTVAQQVPTPAAVFATGLEAPRGLKFGPDGYLYVAEAGTGGSYGPSSAGYPTCPQVPGPFPGPYKGSSTGGRISKVDHLGHRTTLADTFPTTQDSGGDLMGVADVAFLDGTLYALVAGGGCSHGNPNSPSGIARVDRTTGKWNLIADIGAFLKAHPTKYMSSDDFEPDGSLYSLIAVDGVLYTVEPNHGQVLSVTKSGRIQQVIDVSASEGHIVPTSIAERHGTFYVGNLNLFPIDPQWARVLSIAKDRSDFDAAPGFDADGHGYHVVSSKAGFTTVVAVDFGPDGLLYALEMSAAPGFPNPFAGKVVRVKRSGAIEDVITGLMVPTGMTFGPDGALYISNFGAVPVGAAPLGSGQILRFYVAPGW